MPTETNLDAAFWLLLLLAAIAAAGTVAAWLLLARAKRIEAQFGGLERLAEIQAQIAKIAAGSEGLDLRRLEHVLIDVRDNQRRLEERLIAIVENDARDRLTAHTEEARALVPAAPSNAGALADRIVTRLLALGYERVVLVTPTGDLPAIASDGGAVVVEARRDGAACKGRVLIQGGMIADIQIQSAYSTFP
jgi:hypothetical protein